MRIHSAAIAYVKRFYLFAPDHGVSFSNTLDKYLHIESFYSGRIGKTKSEAWKRIAQNEFIVIINNAIAIAVNIFNIARRYYRIGKFWRFINIVERLKIAIAFVPAVYGDGLSHLAYDLEF